MLAVDLRSDVDKIVRKLGAFDSRQLPFAVAKSLTATAKAVQEQATNDIPNAFVAPTSFTRRAFTIKAARKGDLVAWVFAKDAQARYLAFGIQGGERRVKGFERRIDAIGGEANVMLVPTRNVRKDASGNVSLATIRRIAGQANAKKFFIGTPQGQGRGFGVYERMRGGKLRALLVEADVKPYRKRLDLMGIGVRVIRARFGVELEAAIRHALATAR